MINFSFTLVKECREILENSSLEIHDQLKVVISAVEHISEDMSTRLRLIEEHVSPEEEALRDIAIKTTKCVRKLIEILENFNLESKRRGIITTLRLHMRATPKRKDIESIRKERDCTSQCWNLVLSCGSNRSMILRQLSTPPTSLALRPISRL